MQLATGTKIRWESAAGVLRGTITNVVLAPASSGKIMPWIDIAYTVSKAEARIFKDLSYSQDRTTRLCASAESLKMLGVAIVA